MKRDVKPKTNYDAIDPILADEQELIPSSGFLAATIERVRDEAAMPKPILFPWLRALPGIVLAIAVLGWCGFEFTRAILTSTREISLTQIHLTAATGRALEPVAWVAAAFAVSMLSWLFAWRLIGGSELL